MRLKRVESRRGRSFLYRMLQRLDSEAASRIALNDSYRVIRSLEIRMQTGKTISELQLAMPDRFHAVRFFVHPAREELQQNIRLRIDEMFAMGWTEEVERLLSKYENFLEMPAAAAIGYREIAALLEGKIDFESCKETIFRRTCRYAKLQNTWFRNQDAFLPVSGVRDLHKIVESVLQ